MENASSSVSFQFSLEEHNDDWAIRLMDASHAHSRGGNGLADDALTAPPG